VLSVRVIPRIYAEPEALAALLFEISRLDEGGQPSAVRVEITP
jgi:hypothetical protein